MLSKQEIWTRYVKRVMTSSNDISSAAKRLHQGHDLIFGKTKDSHQLDEIRKLAKKTTSAHKNQIWNACLENAKDSEKDPDTVATALLRVCHIVFDDKAMDQDLHSRQGTRLDPHLPLILTIGISDKDH